MKWPCILLCMLLSSCSTQKFVQRQLKRHPEWATDTTVLVRWDTLHTKAYVHDTTYTLNLVDSTDTLEVNNDTVRVVITRYKDRLQVRTVVKPTATPYKHSTVVIRQVKAQVKRHWIKALWEEGWQLFLLLGSAMVATAIIRGKR